MHVYKPVLSVKLKRKWKDTAVLRIKFTESQEFSNGTNVEQKGNDNSIYGFNSNIKCILFVSKMHTHLTAAACKNTTHVKPHQLHIMKWCH